MATNPAFEALFAQSRDLLSDGLGAGMAGMLAKAEESITGVADKTDDQELRKLLIEARDVAVSQRNVIEKQFRERYAAEFRKATNKAKKSAASFADISLGELSLVEEDDLNETLKYNAAAARIKRECEEELSAIDQRVRVLLEDATIESDDNPFGAQVICDAFKQVCKATGAGVQVRLILLKLFEDHMPEAAADAYQKVNDLLVANQILPKIKYGITKSKSDKKRPSGEKAPAGGEAEKAAAAPEPEEAGDIFARIQKMLAPIAAQGGPPAPGMGVGNVPLVQGTELQGSLTKLQTGDFTGVTNSEGVDISAILAAASGMTNVLKELKTSNVGGSMGQMDAMTLDIVSMLFDEIFEDQKVPIALKGLIGRLQLPMLKVALADKDLFTKKEHPARMLLDALGQIGMRLPADFDDTQPLFKRLEGFIQGLVDEFREKMEVFDKVRAELDEIIAEYDSKVAQEMEASAKQLQQAESLAIAKAAAQDAITERVEGKGAPRAVGEFLAQHWIKYLLIVHAREGKESAAWKEALETIDQLLWSIEPKAAVEDRRKLAGTIPALLKRVRAGVTAASIEPEASTAFFGALMKCHTEVMQAPPKAKEVKKETVKEGAAVKKSAAVSAGALAAAAGAAKGSVAKQFPAPPPKPAPPEDDFLDFTKPVVVDNPFGEGKVEVASEDLDFTAAAPALAVAAAAGDSADAGDRKPKRARETIPLPARLIEGAWVELIEPNEQRKPAKLHYVSPMKSHFLFVDRKGNKVYECSRSMLARRLDNFEINILEEEPDASLFDRIMEGIFGKLGATAPA